MKIIPALKWHRLFDECEDTSTLINRTVIDIERGLNKIKVIKDSFPFSFLSGHFGLALFNSYFYKANFQERSVANAISNIKTGLDALSQANVSYSFCNGLSGILWTLKCFEKDNFINEDTLQTSTLNDLFSKGLDEMGNRNYDYLHGALGICLPALLNLNQKNSYVFLEKITQKLKETVETTTDQYKWESYNPTTQTTEFNLGLSHGMPSIIVILSLIYEANIQKDLCLKLLTGSINWLLSQKLLERSLSIFPYTVPKMETKKKELYPSRLAWC